MSQPLSEDELLYGKTEHPGYAPLTEAELLYGPSLAPPAAHVSASNVVKNSDALGGEFMGAFRGMADVGNSLLQMGDFGPPDVNVPGLGPTTNPFNREARAADLAGYERVYGDNPWATGGRVFSNLAMTVNPLMRIERAITGLPAAAGVIGDGKLVITAKNMLTGAGQGVGGAAMLSGGSELPFGQQLVAGGLLGLVLGPLAPVVQSVGGWAYNKGAKPVLEGLKRVYRSVAGDANPLVEDAAGGANRLITGNPETEHPVEAALRAHGRQAAELTPEVRQSAAAEASEQLKATGAVNADSLARKANLEMFGIKPTKAMVSRDALHWADEVELAKHEDGRVIKDTIDQANDKLRTKLSETADQFGGASNSQFDAGTSLVDFFKAKDKVVNQAVSDAYTAVRQKLGDRPGIALDDLIERMAPLEDETAGVPIVNAVKARMKRWKALNAEGEAGEEFTVKKAEELRKFISDQGGDTKADIRIRKQLIDALDDSVTKSIGFDPFQGARKLAAERFAANESSRIIELISEGKVKVDDFFLDRYVISKTVEPKDLANLLKYLQSGTPEQVQAGQKVVANMRQQVAKSIWEGSVIGGTPSEGTVSYKQLRTKLEAIGPEKLRILFGQKVKDGYASLLQATHDVQVPPQNAPINRSNTAAQGKKNKLMDSARAGIISKVPFVGGMLGELDKAAKDAALSTARQKAADNMVLGTAFPPGSAKPLPISPFGRQLAVPAGVATKNALLNGGSSGSNQ